MALWTGLLACELFLASAGLGLPVCLGGARRNNRAFQTVDILFQELTSTPGKAFTLEVSASFLPESCTGEFNAFRVDDGLSPLEAKQRYSAQSPGLVWDATISMASFAKERVRDAYLVGQRSIKAKNLSGPVP